MTEPLVAATPKTSSVHDSLLLIFADALDDLERTRIATENRARALRQVKGMDDTPEEARLTGLVAALAALEHAAGLDLKRALRAHPLGPWVKATVGIGEKQGARLIAAIGDPYLRDGLPRTVSQLWAYCGLHVLHPGRLGPDTQFPSAGVDPSSDVDQIRLVAQPCDIGVAPKRRRGQTANWNATAKMRAYLCAVSCIKQAQSPYRAVYLARRAHTAVTHPDWTDGHSHNDGLRVTSKAILRDLWIEGRRLARCGAQPNVQPPTADLETSAA